MGPASCSRWRTAGGYLESAEEIPEPHAFLACLLVDGRRHTATFEEHDHDGPGHGAAHRDNNMRAAVIHVMADAAVSVLFIVGLNLARGLGWRWMDPLAGIAGACVIASWSYGLIRDTGAILLDMVPDRRVAERIRRMVEEHGDALTDLHVWRLGPGHLGAIVAVSGDGARDVGFYRDRIAGMASLSHVTVEVQRLGSCLFWCVAAPSALIGCEIASNPYPIRWPRILSFLTCGIHTVG